MQYVLNHVRQRPPVVTRVWRESTPIFGLRQLFHNLILNTSLAPEPGVRVDVVVPFEQTRQLAVSKRGLDIDLQNNRRSNP